MFKEGASSIRFRLILDFSKWGKMRMPRGGIFDSDSLNSLTFSNNNVLCPGFSGKDVNLRT